MMVANEECRLLTSGVWGKSSSFKEKEVVCSPCVCICSKGENVKSERKM